MSADNNVSPILRQPDLPAADTINALNESLAHARATLDLIYCLIIDRSGIGLESLDDETLGRAISGAMDRIDEALAAADRLPRGTPASEEVRS